MVGDVATMAVHHPEAQHDGKIADSQHHVEKREAEHNGAEHHQNRKVGNQVWLGRFPYIIL